MLHNSNVTRNYKMIFSISDRNLSGFFLFKPLGISPPK